MNDYNSLTREEIVGNIRDIAEKADEEMSKDDIDEKKLFKLRYAQMIQGLYLQNF